jgi:hypothetical protein
MRPKFLRGYGVNMDYAKMPKVQMIDASDLGDTAVLWCCIGMMVGMLLGQWL